MLSLCSKVTFLERDRTFAGEVPSGRACFSRAYREQAGGDRRQPLGVLGAGRVGSAPLLSPRTLLRTGHLLRQDEPWTTGWIRGLRGPLGSLSPFGQESVQGTAGCEPSC